MNWISRWPKVGRILSNTAFAILAVIVLGGIIILDVGFSVIAARTNGEVKGYNAGLVDGYADACRTLATQIRWTFNVEDSLVAAGKDSPAIGDKVRAVGGGAYQYTCAASGTRIVANIYYPSALSPSVPLGPVSLPVSAVKTGCPACLLKGQPSPSPTGEDQK